MSFLEQFFGAGNDLSWDSVRPGAEGPIAKAIRPFLPKPGEVPGSLVLPRARGGRTTWYAMATTAARARVLREELLAWVGPSYSDFHGQYARLDSSDPVESAVLEHAGRNVFRLEILNPQHKRPCREALARMVEVRARKPRTVRLVARPSGRVLRDFELAVRSGARREAEGYLEELRQQGGVSGRNLRFLEVHLLDSFGDRDALNDVLDDGAVVQSQRPARVTEALIRAVYVRDLQAFESANDPRGALEYFAMVVRPRFGRLWQSLAGLDGPSVVKSFLLEAAAAETPRAELRDRLLERYPSNRRDRPYVEALAGLTPATSTVRKAGPSSPLDGALSLFGAGDLDGALDALKTCPMEGVALDLLLRCALEIGGVEAAVDALASFEDATSAEQDRVRDTPRLSRVLEQLLVRFDGETDKLESKEETSAGPAIPSGWPAWLARIEVQSNWPGALEVAAQGAREWRLPGADVAGAEAAQIVELLARNHGSKAAEVLSHAIPHLLHFFNDRAAGLQAFQPVRLALLDRLIFDEAASIENIRAAGRVLEGLLQGSLREKEAGDALSLVQEAWLQKPAFELLDWALDLLETFVLRRPVEESLLLGLATVVRSELDRWRERLSPSQVTLFSQLCREGGFADVAAGIQQRPDDENDSGTEPDVMASSLSDRVVALYSLRKESAERVAHVLKELAPTAEVRLFADKVGGGQLRAAARTADIFVIVTGAAKHAATEFIESHRPAEAATIRCHTTGSAGLLRTIEEWARG